MILPTGPSPESEETSIPLKQEIGPSFHDSSLPMPFCYRTARRPLRHLISLRDVDRAIQQVTGEMGNLGLWCPRLDDVTV